MRIVGIERAHAGGPSLSLHGGVADEAVVRAVERARLHYAGSRDTLDFGHSLEMRHRTCVSRRAQRFGHRRGRRLVPWGDMGGGIEKQKFLLSPFDFFSTAE